jgi:hypothetical protein
LIVLLNSLYKKLVTNEGILLDDDLNRAVNEHVLTKIRRILKESKEVDTALKILKNERNKFENNRLVGYLTFLQKCDILDKAIMQESLK